MTQKEIDLAREAIKSVRFLCAHIDVVLEDMAKVEVALDRMERELTAGDVPSRKESR